LSTVFVGPERNDFEEYIGRSGGGKEDSNQQFGGKNEWQKKTFCGTIKSVVGAKELQDSLENLMRGNSSRLSLKGEGPDLWRIKKKKGVLPQPPIQTALWAINWDGLQQPATVLSINRTNIT